MNRKNFPLVCLMLILILALTGCDVIKGLLPSGAMGGEGGGAPGIGAQSALPGGDVQPTVPAGAQCTPVWEWDANAPFGQTVTLGQGLSAGEADWPWRHISRLLSYGQRTDCAADLTNSEIVNAVGDYTATHQEVGWKYIGGTQRWCPPAGCPFKNGFTFALPTREEVDSIVCAVLSGQVTGVGGAPAAAETPVFPTTVPEGATPVPQAVVAEVAVLELGATHVEGDQFEISIQGSASELLALGTPAILYFPADVAGQEFGVEATGVVFAQLPGEKLQSHSWRGVVYNTESTELVADSGWVPGASLHTNATAGTQGGGIVGGTGIVGMPKVVDFIARHRPGYAWIALVLLAVLGLMVYVILQTEMLERVQDAAEGGVKERMAALTGADLKACAGIFVFVGAAIWLNYAYFLPGLHQGGYAQTFGRWGCGLELVWVLIGLAILGIIGLGFWYYSNQIERVAEDQISSAGIAAVVATLTKADVAMYIVVLLISLYINTCLVFYGSSLIYGCGG